MKNISLALASIGLVATISFGFYYFLDFADDKDSTTTKVGTIPLLTRDGTHAEVSSTLYRVDYVKVWDDAKVKWVIVPFRTNKISFGHIIINE